MPANPIKILLVDDDEDDYLITRDLILQIRERSYELDWINNYDDGLATVQRKEHDICLLDYRLGVHTGLELLRETNAVTLRMPIILLTGQGDQEIDIEAMKAGAADYLVKSQLTTDMLERAIRYAIENKRTQETIRRERDFVNRIMETSPSGILVTDDSGKITFANLRAEEVLGIADREVSSGKKNVLDWQPADIDGNLLSTGSPLKKVLEAGERTNNVHLAVNRAAGERTLLSANAMPLLDAAGKINGMVVTIEDITERLSLEAQLRQSQKMESVGQLAAGVAHDINNILTVIQGHTGILLNQSATFNEGVVKSLKQIGAASERAAGFVQRLLAFSRKQIYRIKILEVNTVIRNLEPVLLQLLGETIKVEIVYHPDLPCIAADVAMIEQIIVNFAVNSRDAMAHGGKLTIEASAKNIDSAALKNHPEAQIGKFICIAVSDTGCGMEKSVLKKIFEPFFTTKEVGKGTGLGLSTVYGIVKQHHGWIEVQSEVGVGTRFQVFLPVAEEATITPAIEPPKPKPMHGGEETILIVEDENCLLELMRDLLGQHRYKVLTAACGPDALKMWEQHRGEVDLLFTDMVMPGGMNGADLARELTRRKPALETIFTSGYTSALVGTGLNEREIIFLPKPYQPNDVVTLIRKTLDAHREKKVENGKPTFPANGAHPLRAMTAA